SSYSTPPPPPPPTLFPYTTLFRSRPTLRSAARPLITRLPSTPIGTPLRYVFLSFSACLLVSLSGVRSGRTTNARPSPITTSARRSEEHTSELQSRENLVCRLLLEK